MSSIAESAHAHKSTCTHVYTCMYIYVYICMNRISMYVVLYIYL